MIIGIVAIAKNLAIGREGKLPWHYSADLKFFKQTTSGGAVVMGRKTFESIGKPLPNRLNIVLSHNFEHPNVFVLPDKAEVMELIRFLNVDVFIIGGASIYREFADVIDKWLVTEIPETIAEADTFMPADFLAEFELKENIRLDEDLFVKSYLRKK